MFSGFVNFFFIKFLIDIVFDISMNIITIVKIKAIKVYYLT